MIKKLSGLLIGLGALLIAVSGILSFQYFVSTDSKDYDFIINELYDMMPSNENGMILSNSDEMPIVEINHLNFTGVISVPKYQCTLPLYALWEDYMISQYPSVYLGTLYDGSLIIGGSDRHNQFDFMKIVNEDDSIFITDMKGKKFSYIIDKIEITKDVSTNNLVSSDHDLVIFVKNTYSFDYTILRCKYRLIG